MVIDIILILDLSIFFLSNLDTDFQSNAFVKEYSSKSSSSGSYVTDHFSISLIGKKKYLLIKIYGNSNNTYKITHTRISLTLILSFVGGIFGFFFIFGLYFTIKECIEKKRLKKKCKVVDQPLIPDNQALTNGYNSQISNPPNYTPQSSPGNTPQDQPGYIPPSQQQNIPPSTSIN